MKLAKYLLNLKSNKIFVNLPMISLAKQIKAKNNLVKMDKLDFNYFTKGKNNFDNIHGVKFSPLRVIPDERGAIFHGGKQSEFEIPFKEVYFTGCQLEGTLGMPHYAENIETFMSKCLDIFISVTCKWF